MQRLLIALCRRILRRPERKPNYPRIAHLESRAGVLDEQRTVPKWMQLMDSTHDED